MNPYMSGLFALLGALIGAMGAIFGQIYESRQQDYRNFQNLVYQVSIEEWKISSTVQNANQVGGGKLTFEEVLLKNLAFSKALRTVKIDDMNEKIAKEIIDGSFDRMLKKSKQIQEKTVKETPSESQVK